MEQAGIELGFTQAETVSLELGFKKAEQKQAYAFMEWAIKI